MMAKNELNPNHAVTQEMRENWHKIAAIILFKSGLKHVTIHVDDIAQMNKWLNGGAICAKPDGDALEIFLVDAKEAERLAREEGGLPV